MDPRVNTPAVELQRPFAARSSFGIVRGPQNLVAGAALVSLAALALWLTSDLHQGTLGAIGPALMPRWLACAVGLCGLTLIISAFSKEGDALERWSLRGSAFVISAILAFALIIRMTFLDHPISAGLLAVALIILALALLPTIRKGRDEVFVE
jgi:hypothetical protein